MAAESVPIPQPAPLPADASQHSHRAHGSGHLTVLPHMSVTAPFATTPPLLPVPAGLCDTVTAMWQQLLPPVLVGTPCHAGQHSDLFQTDWMGCKRRHKTLFHAHRANVFCSFMEREEQNQSLTPVLWLSPRAFGAELLSPALTSSCSGGAVAVGRAPSYCPSPAQTSHSTGLSWRLRNVSSRPETRELLMPLPGNHL